MIDLSFFKNKRVLVTGHTGFKGSWLVETLLIAGAHVTGYSLEPPTDPSLFNLLNLESEIRNEIGDIRDFNHLSTVMKEAEPDIVIHLAAQPIVLTGYKDPRLTYETNVMGTVNVLEAVRNTPSVRSFLNVTTDKVYMNNEWCWGYRETDVLDGYDPYSNSKSCSELVTSSYRKSFFSDERVRVSTARAGNVIGGGDFAPDRIIPDAYRAASCKKPLKVRNPNSIRPYQHVLEPISAYLEIVSRQFDDSSLSGSFNVGPNEEGCVTTRELVNLFGEYWGKGFVWEDTSDSNAVHEASFLRLDISKIDSILGWRPKWQISKAVEKTVELYCTIDDGKNVRDVMDEEIKEYFS